MACDLVNQPMRNVHSHPLQMWHVAKTEQSKKKEGKACHMHVTCPSAPVQEKAGKESWLPMLLKAKKESVSA